MGKAKRTLGVIMAALMLVVTCMTYVPAKAAVVLPTVKFVGLQNIPAAVGEEQTLFLTSNFDGNVQYQVFYVQRNDPSKAATTTWTKLGDWTTAADAKTPVEVKVPANTITVAGNYSFAIRVKRAGVTGSYSNTYGDYDAAYAFNYAFAATATAGLKDAKLEKAEVAIGEKFVISGLTTGSSYRLFTLNEARTPRWDAAAVATSTTDKLEWAPTTAGKYVLDLQLTDASGKVTAVKLFNVTVVDALKVTGVSAINKTTVKVTYNMDLGSVLAANFAVYDKGNEYSLKTIDSVSVSKNVATITLADNLTTTKEYTVESKNVANATGKITLVSSKDNFTYTEVTTAASISFKATTVGINSSVAYVIKDKDGNDITPNFGTGDVIKETSDVSIVDPDLKTAAKTGSCIVNLTVKDTTVKTGNTIITVVNTLLKPTSVGKYTLASGDITTPVTSLYMGETDYLTFQVLDQNGAEMNAPQVTKTFKSYSPTVAVVDEKSGFISPVAAGTATILITGTDANNVSVSKTVTIEVKAKKTQTSLKLDKTSVTLVKGSGINAIVKVNVLDQYGNKVDLNTGAVSYSLANAAVAGVSSTGFASGTDTITFTPGALDTATSSVLTITYGTMKAYVTVNHALKGTFAGYKAVAVSGTKLDITPDSANNDGSPASSEVAVYSVDTNGNYTGKLADGVTIVTEDKDYVTTTGTTVNAKKVGTEVVTVKVNTVTVGTLTFTVVNTDEVLTKVSQLKNVITVENGKDVYTILFGADKAGGEAFVGYDQYGSKIAFAKSDVQLFSSNKDVVDPATFTSHATNDGTATLTLLVGDNVYVVTVKVQ